MSYVQQLTVYNDISPSEPPNSQSSCNEYPRAINYCIKDIIYKPMSAGYQQSVVDWNVQICMGMFIPGVTSKAKIQNSQDPQLLSSAFNCQLCSHLAQQAIMNSAIRNFLCSPRVSLHLDFLNLFRDLDMNYVLYYQTLLAQKHL